MEALMKIQQELKAPKGQYNSFGKYHYRSAEDILEAVKPLLTKYGAQLTLSDTIEQIGGRVYVRAKAYITDGKSGMEVTAYAREPEQKKGMDESQITGTASSYARKYALNGLFLIDDTKDADTEECSGKADTKSAAADLASAKQITEIRKLAGQAGTPIENILSGYRLARLEDMPAITAGKAITALEKRIKNKEAN